MLELLFVQFPDQSLIELRTWGRERLSGFFDRAHVREAAALAAKIGDNVHVTLNPVDPKRRQATNAFAHLEMGRATGDRDVLRRSLLLVTSIRSATRSEMPQQRRSTRRRSRRGMSAITRWPNGAGRWFLLSTVATAVT